MVGRFANFQMQSIADSVLDAVDKKCYLPALALALTIPDVYGIVEYGEDRKIGNRYKRCFNHNVKEYKLLKHPSSKDDTRFPVFNGHLCYLLRCSMLHGGKADISNDGVEFSLRINTASTDVPVDAAGIIKRDGKKTSHIVVDLQHLCTVLAHAAKDYEKTITAAGETDKLKRLEAHRFYCLDIAQVLI